MDREWRQWRHVQGRNSWPWGGGRDEAWSIGGRCGLTRFGVDKTTMEAGWGSGSKGKRRVSWKDVRGWGVAIEVFAHHKSDGGFEGCFFCIFSAEEGISGEGHEDVVWPKETHLSNIFSFLRYSISTWVIISVERNVGIQVWVAYRDFGTSKLLTTFC